jgi:hypothetical protein
MSESSTPSSKNAQKNFARRQRKRAKQGTPNIEPQVAPQTEESPIEGDNFTLKRVYECTVCHKAAPDDREIFDVPGAYMAGMVMCRDCASVPANLIPYLEKPQIVPPQSFCLKCPHQCMVCDEIDHNGEHWEITETYLYGWIMCKKCMVKESTKQCMIEYLLSKNSIPFNFIRFSNTPPSFYRHRTGTVIEGKLSFLESANSHFMVKTKTSGKFVISLNFSANPTSGSPKNLARSVSLENLFFHNNWLYQTLTTTENLIGSPNMPLKITWNDFPLSFREEVNALYRVAMASTGVFTD